MNIQKRSLVLALVLGKLLMPAFIDAKCCVTKSSPAFDCIPRTVDFIIVGAGTAGAAVASKLSEEIDGKYNSVLVLEAGANYSDEAEVKSNDPFRSIYRLAYSTKYSDTYSAYLGTELSFLNPPLGYLYTEGRMWGGGSSHNVMFAVRGTPKIYNEWAAEAGNTQWSYDNLLPVMKYLENYMPTGSMPDTNQRGTSGPLCISGNDIETIMTNTSIQIFASAVDAPLVADYNIDTSVLATSAPQWYMDAAPDGFFFPPTGNRCSSATAFLPSRVVDQTTGIGIAPRRLRVASHATVVRVLFEGTTAVGVEYIFNDTPEKIYTVYARKKIVLSAGAVCNVAILQRSGVGDSALLNSLDIPVVLHNPNVGQNLQTHVGVYAAMSAYNFDMDFGSAGYFPSFFSGAPYFGPSNERRIQVGVADSAASFAQPAVLQALGVNAFTGAISINTAILQPKSRGTVEISDKDPLTTPIVQFNLYSDANGDDINTAIATYKKLRKAALAAGEDMVYPTPDQYAAGDFALASAAQAIPFVQWHALGTCKMGTSIANSVVDGTLHVHGINNLMCADCSVEPFAPTGNTAYQAYLIGLVAARECGSQTVPSVP